MIQRAVSDEDRARLAKVALFATRDLGGLPPSQRKYRRILGKRRVSSTAWASAASRFLARLLREAGLPEGIGSVQIGSIRAPRAWPAQNLVVLIGDPVPMRQVHDATRFGWRVLVLRPDQLRDESAVAQVRLALALDVPGGPPART